jgi:transcriptional regulator with XRE-family HTH domain
MSVYETIASRLRKLREREALSQEDLAKKVGVAPNTISRWETITYKPTVDDLERLSRALRVSILEFLPDEQVPSDQPVSALLRSAKGLDKNDLQELRNYANYLRVRQTLKTSRGVKLKSKSR